MIETKSKHNKVHTRKIRDLPLIDPTTGWFEMGRLPENDFDPKGSVR